MMRGGLVTGRYAGSVGRSYRETQYTLPLIVNYRRTVEKNKTIHCLS